MAFPLATQLASRINGDLEALRALVATFIATEADPGECERYRQFGAQLGAFKQALEGRRPALTEEEVELALCVLLVTSRKR